jgi:hypothetical protein
MTENKQATGQELDLLWGAAAIARHLNLKNTRQAFHLLESGALPARKVGKSWVASRAKLKEHFEQVEAA